MPFSGQNLVIALYLIQGLVAGHPLPGSSQCVDDDVLLSFQQGDTSLLCENVLIANETTVTQQETTTVFGSNSIVTSTSNFTPTLFFTMYKDLLVTVTSSAPCDSGVESSAATTTADAGRNGGRDLPISTTSSPLQRSQISSACKCLNIHGVTVTKTATVTSLVPEITQQYMVPALHPVMAYVTIGATNTATVTSCLDELR